MKGNVHHPRGPDGTRDHPVPLGVSHRDQVSDQSGSTQRKINAPPPCRTPPRLPILPRRDSATPTFGAAAVYGVGERDVPESTLRWGPVVTVIVVVWSTGSTVRPSLTLYQCRGAGRSPGYASINWNYLPSAGAASSTRTCRAWPTGIPPGLLTSTSPVVVVTSLRAAASTGTI